MTDSLRFAFSVFLRHIKFYATTAIGFKLLALLMLFHLELEMDKMDQKQSETFQRK